MVSPSNQPVVSLPNHNQMYFSTDERFGVNRWQGNINMYDLEALGARWYMDWHLQVSPLHPGGAEFVQTVRACRGQDVPTPAQIAQAVEANPGALWLIGNEPDCVWQDNCLPGEYAQAYHDAYTLIKSLDPTALVAAGGIVQATPLRMQYLDLVLEAYQARYGQALPADAWHIHTFVLREQRNSWGAGIPPGLGASAGMLYNIRDVDNVDYFREQIVRFRGWMAAHGWRDRPLHVPEYGVLMPEDIVDEDGRDFGPDRMQAFMTATFDYFLNTTDAALGYPADRDRLVQSWAWYSLGDNLYNPQGQLLAVMYNGDLFDGYPAQTLTPLGQAYAAYVAPLVTPYVDLWPQRLGADVGQAWLGATAPVTLAVEIANRGNTTSTAASLVRFASDTGTIDPDRPFGLVPPRYWGTTSVTTTWMALISGTGLITVSLDPYRRTLDANRGNDTRPFRLTFAGEAIPQSLTFEPAVPFLAGDSVTVTARVQIANSGNVAVRDVTAQFWRQGTLLGKPHFVGSLPAGGLATYSLSWTETSPGLKRITVLVSSPATGQKQRSANLLVACSRLFLPVVTRRA